MSLPSFFEIASQRIKRDARKGELIYSTREFCDIEPDLANQEADIQEQIDKVLLLDAEVFNLKAEKDRERSDFKFK